MYVKIAHTTTPMDRHTELPMQYSEVGILAALYLKLLAA